MPATSPHERTPPQLEETRILAVCPVPLVNPAMSDGPRISVVVPAFNAEDTIRDAIASIEAQGVSPLQVIIVDDASGDRTRDVLADVTADRDGYRVIGRQSNGGPAAARNEGIEAARGEWLAFLDGDDAWLPNRLKMQLRLAHEHPDVTLWCGDVVGMRNAEDGIQRTEGGGPQENGRIHEPTNQRIDQSTNPLAAFRDIALEEFVNHNAVATSTVLVRRGAVEAVGGFDPQFVGPEDYDLWMRLAARYRLCRVEAPLSQYRHVPGSLSMDDRRFLPQVLRVLDKAFGEGGAFRPYMHLRDAALSNQLWNASWMAFNRGARITALRYWTRSYLLNRKAIRREERAWFALFIRYLFGRS